MRSLLVLFFGVVLLQSSLGAVETTPNGAEFSEIGLSTGKVLRAIITRSDEKNIWYKENSAAEEKSLPVADAIFIRSGDGSYRFIFPAETPAVENATAPAAEEDMMALAGIALQLADNSSVSGFTRDYANALAADYNARLNPKGFIGEQSREAAALAVQFSAELRFFWPNFILGFGMGYSFLPKSAAVVSSASYSGQETISIDGYFIPATATIYYRMVAAKDWGFNLGFGGGALYSSVLLTRNIGAGSNYEEVASLAPLLQFRPEFTLRAGVVTLVFALPVTWAESRPIGVIGENLSIQNRAVTASLTGVGFQVAAGIRL